MADIKKEVAGKTKRTTVTKSEQPAKPKDIMVALKELPLMKDIADHRGLSLTKKLVILRSTITGITKDAESYKYSYTSGDQLLNKIKGYMDALGVLLYPSLDTHIDRELMEYSVFKYNEKTKKTVETKKQDHLVSGAMSYIWLNADDKDDILVVPWYLFGMQDDPSKAFGSGLTYSERYFIMKFFNISTDADDPDNKNNSSGKNEHRGDYNKYKKQQTNTDNKKSTALLTDAQLWKLQDCMSKLNITWVDLKGKYGEMNKLTKKQASDLISKMQQKIDSVPPKEAVNGKEEAKEDEKTTDDKKEEKNGK